MPNFSDDTEYTVAARFDDAKARIKAAHDQYELLLNFTVALAEVYQRRTGQELRPHDTFTIEDEGEAYRIVASQSGSRA